MTRQEIQHLYWRGGFGIHWNKLEQYGGQSRDLVVQSLLADSRTVSTFSDSDYVVDVGAGMGFQEEFKNEALTEEQKKERVLKNRKQISFLALEWLKKMGSGKESLRERMTFFWHDHFATQSKLSLLNVRHNNMLRKYALGSFREFLHAVVKDPQMLQFLNNNQSKKSEPNENLARELMELFTLGIGQYSEQDIKESAKAFTGYGFGLDGYFQFFPNRHDYGAKTFLGKTGNFEGSDIVDILLENKQTAFFITEKIYRYFVSEIPDATRVKLLAEDFFSHDYDISRLMQQIFMADWFYDKAIMGRKVKSPVDLFAGMMLQGNMTLKQTKVLQLASRVLGQVLCQPPNVAGWPQGTAWIDSSSLLFRTQLAEVVLHGLPVAVREKEAISIETETLDQSYYNPDNNIVATADWSAIDQGLSACNASDCVKLLLGYFLQTPVSGMDLRLLDQLTQEAKTSDLQTVAIHIMRLPEYQLC